MKQDTSQILCRSCGLCCQGQMYEWVGLRAEEISLAESWHLEVVTVNGESCFKQPCACFQEMRCTVYAQRPQTCKEYKCRLLYRLQQNELSFDDALAHVSDARRLFEKIQTRLPMENNKRIWERITERWDLTALQALLAAGELDSDTLMAIVAFSSLLKKYFHYQKENAGSDSA